MQTQANVSTIIVDNVYSAIIDNSSKKIKKIRNAFKVEQDVYLWKNNPALRFSHLISENGRFFTGILDDVFDYFKNTFGEEPIIIDTRNYEYYPESLKKARENMRSMNDEITLRKYQMECVKVGLKNPRAVFEIATGGGKTVIIAGLAAALNVPTVIFCGKKDLAMQIKEELELFLGVPVGIIGDSKIQIETITVAMVPSLVNKKMSKYKKEEIKKFLDSCRYLVIDEVHHINAKTWQEAAKMCRNCTYRHGFTASFLTKKISVAVKETKNDGQEYIKLIKSDFAPLTLLCHTGPAAFHVGIKDLVEAGYLSRPKTIAYTFDHYKERKHVAGKRFANVYSIDIAKNQKRNALVCSIIKEEFDNDSQVLVFTKEVEHGLLIKDMLVNHFGIPDTDVAFVSGAHDKRVRKSLIKDFQSDRLKILIGTSIVGEGLNFFCNAAINAAAGDGDIQTIQRFGRILRKKKRGNADVDVNEENEVRMYEIYDRTHPYFSRHSLSRKKVYNRLGYPFEEIVDGESHLQSMAEKYSEEEYEEEEAESEDGVGDESEEESSWS